MADIKNDSPDTVKYRKVFITPGKVLDKFMENLDIAFKRDFVRKPHA